MCKLAYMDACTNPTCNDACALCSEECADRVDDSRMVLETLAELEENMQAARDAATHRAELAALHALGYPDTGDTSLLRDATMITCCMCGQHKSTLSMCTKAKVRHAAVHIDCHCAHRHKRTAATIAAADAGPPTKRTTQQ
jgi:hypothetical protein